MTDSSLLEPSIALAAYTEPLASNRRVLVFGNALGALSVQLLERGARSVHVCDADEVCVAEAATRNRSSQITFSSLSNSDSSVQSGGFDLVLIENLGALGPRGLLQTARRALAPRGAAVVACPNPDAAFPLLPSKDRRASSLDYYALYDAVAAEFEHVRMLGQTPFVGYAIADFSAAGDPEPALDTSFVPGGAEEPDLFIALASQHELRLEEFAVIQLPTRRLLAGRSVNAEKSPPVKAADPEVTRLNQWIQELESRASTADERADHAETELEELRAKLDTGQRAAAELKAKTEREVAALGAELSAKASALSEASGELESKTAELARVSAKLATRAAEDAEQAAEGEHFGKSEVAAFESQLSERGQELRKLEQDLRTAERTGRELARELERRQSELDAQGSAKLERALAEREADLQAAAWTIESLSLRLELAGKAPSEAAPKSQAATEPAAEMASTGGEAR